MSPGVANPPLLRMDPAAYAPVRNISIRREFQWCHQPVEEILQVELCRVGPVELPCCWDDCNKAESSTRVLIDYWKNH